MPAVVGFDVLMFVYVGVKLGMTTGRIPTHIGVLHFLAFPIVFSMMGLCSTMPIQNLSRLPRLGLCAGAFGRTDARDLSRSWLRA